MANPFVHVELATTDLDKAKSFYRSLFDWQLQDVDMGGGSTTIAVFAEGRLVYADGFAVGGNHVTMDIARGLTMRAQMGVPRETLLTDADAAADVMLLPRRS